MGFQFNHVGGGTKTRRPIAINMKYNAMCHEPRCYLARWSPFNGSCLITHACSIAGLTYCGCAL